MVQVLLVLMINLFDYFRRVLPECFFQEENSNDRQGCTDAEYHHDWKTLLIEVVDKGREEDVRGHTHDVDVANAQC